MTEPEWTERIRQIEALQMEKEKELEAMIEAFFRKRDALTELMRDAASQFLAREKAEGEG